MLMGLSFFEIEAYVGEHWTKLHIPMLSCQHVHPMLCKKHEWHLRHSDNYNPTISINDICMNGFAPANKILSIWILKKWVMFLSPVYEACRTFRTLCIQPNFQLSIQIVVLFFFNYAALHVKYNDKATPTFLILAS